MVEMKSDSEKEIKEALTELLETYLVKDPRQLEFDFDQNAPAPKIELHSHSK